MFTHRRFLATILLIGVAVALSSCGTSDLISSSAKRVTFALVIDTRAYNGKSVIADLEQGSTTLETLSAPFASYPNTATQAWAQLTTLDTVPTGERYELDFFIDMNGDGVKDSGDLTGSQFFDVMPNANWCETKYFVSELSTVP
jgi:hypothetical protein